ncbi:MAG: hypothetical protein J7K39_02265 [Bacteroidales bacterium]|nr:hypothetical protein [Bacteroidales bacterium]
MTDIEELFIESLKDLRAKIEDPQKYNNLKASGVLRLLLMDDNPLLHQANRLHRIPINFVTRKTRTIKPFPGLLFSEGIVPVENENLKDLETLKLDHFLEKVCLIYHTNVYTVKDIIKINAHIKGGVHAGKPKDLIEKEALNLSAYGPSVGYKEGAPMDMVVSLIYPISKIVTKSLETLENKIIEKYK